MKKSNPSSFSREELLIHNKSIDFIKKNKINLINKFCNSKIFQPVKNPISIFMAGSPGSGKTEFSQNLIKLLKNEKIVRIDADEIRDFIPYYNGHNSYLVQGGASLGVEKILDYSFKKQLNFILDGTFAKYKKAKTNIMRSLKRKRSVKVYYAYQNPLVAWDFVQKREKIEHRYVPKDFFNFSLTESRKNIKKIVTEFENLIEVNVVINNNRNQTKAIYHNIKDIDKYIGINYTNSN